MLAHLLSVLASYASFPLEHFEDLELIEGRANLSLVNLFRFSRSVLLPRMTGEKTGGLLASHSPDLADDVVDDLLRNVLSSFPGLGFLLLLRLFAFRGSSAR